MLLAGDRPTLSDTAQDPEPPGRSTTHTQKKVRTGASCDSAATRLIDVGFCNER